MGRRRKAREETLRILYRLEFDNRSLEETIDQYWENKRAHRATREYSTWLVSGVISHLKKIDTIIQQASEHWRISRMALIDRNIIRIAAFELLYEENIAPAIIINEAIEIAKMYSGEEAATFVNGILDAIRKNLKKIKKSLKDKNDG
jgi:N utilization substance protein B